jgi:hypothetical protein
VNGYLVYTIQRTNRGILPCDVEEEWVEHEGRLYAVLSNVNGILAVYRVKKDGSLKGINAEWFEKRVYNKEN